MINIKLPFLTTKMISGKRFPFFKQSEAMDCGPTCLKMVTAYHGKTFPLQFFRRICGISKSGTTISGLMYAAKELGFKSMAIEVGFDRLVKNIPLPCILHWEKGHYVVLYEITSDYAYVADPSLDRKVKMAAKDFQAAWQIAEDTDRGRALLLEPTDDFHRLQEIADHSTSLWSLIPYLKNHKRTLWPVIFSLLLASGFSLCIPLLTQLIVDKGIAAKNKNLLLLICAGQLLLFSGRMLMDFIRARWLFKIGARTSITMVKEFLARLMRLPFTFFDSRQAGDNMQRVTDNQRVEDFLTNTLINSVISIITLVVMGGVLAYYNWQIFLLFLTGAALSFLWSNSFQQKREIIDQKKFKLLAANQQLLLEIFSAMQEIKLTGSEEEKKDLWENLQDRSYGLKLESLQLDQFMQGVGSFINEVKNILITYAAAMLVINDHITLGAMLAVTYICGQLSSPVVQLIDFVRVSQNIRFILRRMAEVHLEPEEDFSVTELPLPDLPADIHINDVSFRYGNQDMPLVLKQVNLVIPAGKTTAVVGMSGSGKTTLMKLLLKFYQPVQGTILIGDTPIDELHARQWRKSCGVVMQDGYIFMDTIANNIYVGATEKNADRLQEAARFANMHDFFLSLPFGYETVVGKEGVGLSEGQKQRLLIARLIYRNPSYIFLDEATNSLDANNELAIVNNLNHFFSNKTVLVVAHRLSTVKNADQIVVMHNGEIVEVGNHLSLIQSGGKYYHLIKNQLELGK